MGCYGRSTTTEDNPNGYKFLAKLLNAGLQAHDNDKDNKVKTMIHLAGVKCNLYHTFFDNLIVKNKVNDFDIIGMSFYPFWHGTMDDLKNTMNDVSAKYNKDVIAVETAFGYTLKMPILRKIILEQMKKKSVVIKLQCK